MIAPAHLDLASWVLSATFLLFCVLLAAAVVSSWLQYRRPPRTPGVLESVFRLRQEGLIDGDLAASILDAYDHLDVDSEPVG